LTIAVVVLTVTNLNARNHLPKTGRPQSITATELQAFSAFSNVSGALFSIVTVAAFTTCTLLCAALLLVTVDRFSIPFTVCVDKTRPDSQLATARQPSPKDKQSTQTQKTFTHPYIGGESDMFQSIPLTSS
tara:strand:- start:25060 stop:25452 length:393 start_codon:yes stop_codon:yes gene_type:complete